SNQLVDLGLIFFRHIGNDQVLVAGQTELSLVNLGNFTHTRQPGANFGIHDAARIDTQAQVPAAIAALGPAEAVAIVVKVIGARRLQRLATAVLHFFQEPVGTQLIHGVFQASMTAFVAVAVVTLCGDNGFANGQQLLGANKADYAAQSRVGGV